MGGCKQGVSGALLELAGLSLSAVPYRAEPPRPPYYSLLQQNSSRLNEKNFPGGETEDQVVTTSCTSSVKTPVKRRKNPRTAESGPFQGSLHCFKMNSKWQILTRTLGIAEQNYCTAAAWRSGNLTGGHRGQTRNTETRNLCRTSVIDYRAPSYTFYLSFTIYILAWLALLWLELLK